MIFRYAHPVASLQVLIVDDEKNIRQSLRICLEGLGVEVAEAATDAAAREAMRQGHPDLVFLDLRLGQRSGLDLIPELIASHPSVIIVIITAYATVETAVEAIRRGAWDYLPKPFTPAQIRHLMDRITNQRLLTQRAADLEYRLRNETPDVLLTTHSQAVRTILDVLQRAAAVDVPVLLRGENGTGKGVLARWVHDQSKRRDCPFVVVNCPTLSEELLASELFGHVKGAFTGAFRDQPGRVEAAESGTLFLDEIGELSGTLQAKLLRFLQEKQFERIGDPRTRQADVRIVAATNRNLDADVQSGKFREDLYYRLNVIEVNVPALRERREDILPLTQHFLAFFARTLSRTVPDLSPEAEKTLVDYPWPGNVRELRNTLERALILWPSARLPLQAFPDRITGATSRGPQVGENFSLEVIERTHIEKVLSQTASLDEAAAILQIDSSTLWRKRKKFEEG
jgi:NtrC-family two-component system response regulator AlgB